MLEVGADRKARREPCDLGLAAQELGDVQRRRLAGRGRIGGQQSISIGRGCTSVLMDCAF